MKSQNKKVLAIAYFYPPIGGGGVQRTVKFLKHLAENGYDAVVLTPKAAKHTAFDESYKRDLPESLIEVRTKYFGIHPPKARGPKKQPSPRQNISEPQAMKKESALIKIVRAAFHWIESMTAIPDTQFVWKFFAVRAGVKAVREHKIDVIYSTSSPYTDHNIARAIHNITGVPWVADFRDEWTLAPTYKPRTPVHRFLAEQMERGIVADADYLIHANPQCTAKHKKTFGSKTPVTSISNGYDPEDFDRSVKYQHKGAITMLYSGSLYGKEYTAKEMIEAFNVLLARAEDEGEAIEITFQGDIDTLNKQIIQASPYFGRNIFLASYIPHQEITRRIQETTLPFSSVPKMEDVSDEVVTSQKIFNYMGARRPQLAFCHPGGRTARVLRKTQAGRVVSLLDSPEERAATIHAYLQELREQNWEIRFAEDYLKKYDRRNLTKRLARVLDGVQK